MQRREVETRLSGGRRKVLDESESPWTWVVLKDVAELVDPTFSGREYRSPAGVINQTETGDPDSVRRRSALSWRSRRRYSARLVNIR